MSLLTAKTAGSLLETREAVPLSQISLRTEEADGHSTGLPSGVTGDGLIAVNEKRQRRSGDAPGAVNESRLLPGRATSSCAHSQASVGGDRSAHLLFLSPLSSVGDAARSRSPILSVLR